MIWGRRKKPMLSSRAEVATDSPERFAKQLAAHLGHRVSVENTPDGRLFRFDAGEGLVQVGEGVLVLAARGQDEQGLAVVQDVLGRHLLRFGEKAGITVTWSPATPG